MRVGRAHVVDGGNVHLTGVLRGGVDHAEVREEGLRDGLQMCANPLQPHRTLASCADVLQML